MSPQSPTRNAPANPAVDPLFCQKCELDEFLSPNFDFNENGPFPCDIPESSANGVLEEDFVLPDEKGIRNFNFDDNQADIIIEKLKTPSEFDEYGEYIVLIGCGANGRISEVGLKK